MMVKTLKPNKLVLFQSCDLNPISLTIGSIVPMHGGSNFEHKEATYLFLKGVRDHEDGLKLFKHVNRRVG